MKFIMIDGDAQQQNEIVKAQRIFPSAVKGAFGWHTGEKID